ncbi:hypothetical protein Leryth_023311 [Lithospermum erythrorhizon]|nr:hypothetical protein Leryth_023311 [Lithospermum erythrorhizon]
MGTINFKSCRLISNGVCCGRVVEHEVLERERGRLRALYQKQKQPQLQPEPKTGGPQRTSSRDLDQQLAKLSLKHKDASHGQDLLSDQLHI